MTSKFTCGRCKKISDSTNACSYIWIKGDTDSNYYFLCEDCSQVLKRLIESSEMGTIDPNIECNFYNKHNIYHNCTVQTLENSVTGKISVGWYKDE